MILTVTLNPALDIIDCPSLKPRICAGGKGVNVARTLKCLGHSATALVCLAGRNGRVLLKNMRKEGLSFLVFNVEGETRINRTYVDRSSVRRLIEEGPVWTKKEAVSFTDLFARKSARFHFVVLSGRLPPSIPPDFYSKLIGCTKGNLCLLDTSGQALKFGVKTRPWLVKPNREEAEYFCGFRLDSRRKLRKALLSFRKYAIKNVLISLGNEGAVLGTDNEEWFAQGPIIQTGHSVGCGDSFLGGFLAALIENKRPEEALKLAIACGACNMFSITPGQVSKKRVKDVVKDIFIEKLNN